MSKGDDIDAIIQEGIVWGRGARNEAPAPTVINKFTGFARKLCFA